MANSFLRCRLENCEFLPINNIIALLTSVECRKFELTTAMARLSSPCPKISVRNASLTWVQSDVEAPEILALHSGLCEPASNEPQFIIIVTPIYQL